MKIGDLVTVPDRHQRALGTVLRFDTYAPQTFESMPETLAEVLWCDGSIGWIIQCRLKVTSPREKKY